MKKVTLLLLLATIVVGKAFATDTTITVCVSSQCLTPQGVTLTATVSPNFTGNIYWQKTHPGYSTWNPTILDTGSVFVVRDFPGTSGVYRAFIRAANGTNYFSYSVCLYKCNVVSLKSLDILSGGISQATGRVLLRFKPEGFTVVNLQVSNDRIFWNQVADITSDTSYVGTEKVLTTSYYRLEGVLSDGTRQYSQKHFKVSPLPVIGIQYQKPFTARLWTNTGQLIGTKENIIVAGDSKTAFDRIIQMFNMPGSRTLYRIECIQDSTREVLGGIR